MSRFPLVRIGRYRFTVLAWKDRFGSFVEELERKSGAPRRSRWCKPERAWPWRRETQRN
jgi:hypothetical protein